MLCGCANCTYYVYICMVIINYVFLSIQISNNRTCALLCIFMCEYVIYIMYIIEMPPTVVYNYDTVLLIVRVYPRLPSL